MLSFKDHKVKEAIDYNIANEIPLSECVYRRETELFYEYFNFLRNNKSEYEIDRFGLTLLETNLGEKGMYEGEEVPLDLPFIEEDKDVELNKPKRGGPKKFYVYVKDPKTGNVKKVAFGDTGASTGGKTLRVKINDKDARKAFADRHDCANAKDKTKPSYWSCNLPRYAKALGLGDGGNFFW